jgi:hypothetical protein
VTIAVSFTVRVNHTGNMEVKHTYAIGVKPNFTSRFDYDDGHVYISSDGNYENDMAIFCKGE